ncbi:MAG: hypothetical protein OWQ54_04340 [Sulfolobaceae archaeon]|nr:hypothetical protein [Sulfolobaceae archaeon]
MPIIVENNDEDPDVDIFLKNDGTVAVYVDLRGRELKYDNIRARTDGNKLYLFDSTKNYVIKVISLPTKVDSNYISLNVKYGILIILLKKVN